MIIRNDGTAAGTYCIADAVRFVGVGGAAVPPPAPVIEIVASDGVAKEFGSDPARFTFVRSGDTNPALTITYQVGGSATPGSDFAALPGAVVLQSGQVATQVWVWPLPDALAEGDETVVLSLQPSASYALGALSNATAVIRDLPRHAWRRGWFSEMELADPAISGDAADPDGDGLPNLLEYALGTNPRSPGINPLGPRIEQGRLTLTCTRARAAVDVAPGLEISPDLQQWQSAEGWFEEVSCDDEGDRQRVTLRMTTPTSGQTAAYVRLRVQKL